MSERGADAYSDSVSTADSNMVLSNAGERKGLSNLFLCGCQKMLGASGSLNPPRYGYFRWLNGQIRWEVSSRYGERESLSMSDNIRYVAL